MSSDGIVAMMMVLRIQAITLWKVTMRRMEAEVTVVSVVPTSVGSVGDSYDNALAETNNGLYKTELIKPHGPWGTLDAVEYATAESVDWYNHRRLYEYCGDIPPVEAEQHHCAQKAAQPTAELSHQVSLRTCQGGSWISLIALRVRKTSGHEFERYDAPLARTTATGQCAC